MSERLRVGIIGASGWMAGALAIGIEYQEKSFDPHSRRGKRSAESVVTALCDLNRQLMDHKKEELGLLEARCFDSYDALLDDESIDAVVVAVPNHLHAAFGVKALHAGKHLFLEKPLATACRDSLTLIEKAASTDLTTKLDYIMIHYDEQENLRGLVDRHAFGDLASVHFTYRHPIQASESPEQIWKLSRGKTGGAIPMGICHAISMTVYQVDSLPSTVVCQSSPPKVRSFDYDTQIDMLITFENGVVGVVQGNIDFAEKYDARHTLIGSEGQFDYMPFNPIESRVAWSSRKLGRPYGPDPTFARHHLDSGDVWKHQCSRTIQSFVEHALREEKDPLLGLESPLVTRTEAVIWAAERSASDGGRPVDVASVLSSPMD